MAYRVQQFLVQTFNAFSNTIVNEYNIVICYNNHYSNESVFVGGDECYHDNHALLCYNVKRVVASNTDFYNQSNDIKMDACLVDDVVFDNLEDYLVYCDSLNDGAHVFLTSVQYDASRNNRYANQWK